MFPEITQCLRGLSERPLSAALALLLCIFAPLASATAQSVSTNLQADSIYGDEATHLVVQVAGSPRGLGRPRLEPVPGLRIQGPSSPRFMNINGRRSVTYQFLIQPESNSRRSYRIGPVKIPRTTSTSLLSSRGTLELNVYKRPPIGARVTGALSDQGGLSQEPFFVYYTIEYSGRRADETRRRRDTFGFGVFDRQSPFGLTELSLPILDRTDLVVSPVRVLDDQDGTTVDIGNNRRVYVQEGFKERDDGTGYRTLNLGFRVLPLRTGPLDVGKARIGLKLQTGEERQVRRDLFGDVHEGQVPKFESFASTMDTLIFTVSDPPVAGRPASYNGAVGKYRILATAAQTEVDAFAPITVDVRVSLLGQSDTKLHAAIMENLSQPLWTKEPELTKNFDVTGNIDPGALENGMKHFAPKLRPLGAHVTEIPPLPFPYYNPQTERYEIAKSQPIPIKVRAVKTVTAADAIVKSGAPRPSTNSDTSTAAVIFERRGIGANYSTMGSAIVSLDPSGEIFSVRFFAVLFAPPILFMLALLARRAARTDPTKTRRDKALTRARVRLGRVDRGFDEAVAAFQDYFRERLELGSGEITPPDLRRALQEHGVPTALGEATTELLENFLSARFGGGTHSATELADRAEPLLKEINECLR